MKRIVITGLGAVTPIGIGVSSYWQSLIAGACGVTPITRYDTTPYAVKVAAQVGNFDAAALLPHRLAKDAALFSQYAYVAAEEALAQSGLDCRAESSRIGITMGTAMSGIADICATQAEATASGRTKITPRFVPKILGNIAASQIAIEKGLTGPCVTVSTACSSGADALKLANMLLQAEEADAVLAVGSEAGISPLVASSLSMARALSKNPSSTASRPFDASRDGFVMGEGGGAMVLETEDHALARGATILGTLLAVTNNTDGYHVTSPAPDGHGAIDCMQRALRQAGLSPAEIGYINAHGTSTPMGDAIELNAIKAVFGSTIPYVSSTKGATGHMMGAGGITEAIACLLACREGLLPPSLHLENPDPACEGIPMVANTAISAPIHAAMSNAFGFGGQNTSVIVAAYR